MRSFNLNLLVAASLLTLVACSQPLTVSQQIIAVIQEMETRVEDGERRPFMNHVAEDFDGNRGNMNRDGLSALFIYQINRYQKLNVQLFPIHVTETGEGTAEARFRVLVTGGPNWLPESGQLYDVETGWELLEGDWLVVSATWETVRIEELID